MQKDASPHVGQGDESHDDESADQVTLGPCLEDELLGICGLLHHSSTRNEGWSGTHDECERFEFAKVGCRRAAISDVTPKKISANDTNTLTMAGGEGVTRGRVKTLQAKKK